MYTHADPVRDFICFELKLVSRIVRTKGAPAMQTILNHNVAVEPSLRVAFH